MTIEFSSVICVALTLPAVSPNLHSFVANLCALSLATLYCLLCSVLLHFFSIMMFRHAAVVNKSQPIPYIAMNMDFINPACMLCNVPCNSKAQF